MTPPRQQHRRRQRGLALILVLWVFITLGVLALDFGQFMRDDAMAAVNMAETTRGYYIAVAGMNRAIYDLLEAHESDEEPGFLAEDYLEEETAEDLFLDEGAFVPLIAPDGRWHRGKFGGGEYAVRISDEGGLVSINTAPRGLILMVLRSLIHGVNATEGIDRREEATVQTIVDSIMDWRDADGLTREHGAESEFYLAQRPSYRARNGYFEYPEELLYVRGMVPELVYGAEGRPGLRDIFSFHSRQRGVNMRSVTAPVLEVLLGLDAEMSAEFIEERDIDRIAFAERLRSEISIVAPVLEVIFVDEPPRFLRVEAHGDMRHPRNRARVAAVIDLDSDLVDGARVLRWMDDAPWPSEFDVGPDGPAVVDDSEAAIS